MEGPIYDDNDMCILSCAFLIYNFEYNNFEIKEKSEIVKQTNKKINKYGNFILLSNYKYVNNFSYTTNILHYFYKITEHYIFKYVNSIIIDSLFFFKCINEIKYKSSDNFEKEKMKENYNIKLDEDNKRYVCHDNYLFDYNTLHNYVEQFKKIKGKKKKEKEKTINKNINMEDDKKVVFTNYDDQININNNNHMNDNSYMKYKKINNDEPILAFKKSFLYKICEVNDNLHNKKNRMIYLTKIFRKIITRKKIRQFICENEKKKKKKYLQFFLHLSLGIFIYIYIYKYIKQNYKSIEFFIFLNNLKKIKQLYLDQIPHMDKANILNFIKHIKFINIQMFQYIYISFFVNIYKFVNFIYHLAMLSLYNYFKYYYECDKDLDNNNKNNNNNNKYIFNINSVNNISLDNNHKDKKEDNHEYIKEEFEHKGYSNNNSSNFENQNIKYHSLLINNEYKKHLIFDCYIYIFIFFKYIKHLRNTMKCKIEKIQNNIKKIINIFINIYHINKTEINKNKCNVSKKVNISNSHNLINKDENVKLNEMNHNISCNDHFYNIYSNYIHLSKKYKNCIKINYEIIKSIHLFHLLLKHFYNYFPILKITNNQTDNLIIYNYYDKSYIYPYENNNNNKQNVIKNVENQTIDILKDKEEKINNFNVFKNVNEYELDFFYFNETKNDENGTIHSLVESTKMENFDDILLRENEKELSSYNLPQNHISHDYLLEEEKDQHNSVNFLSSEKLFLYLINNKLDHMLLNVHMYNFSNENGTIQYTPIDGYNIPVPKEENDMNNMVLQIGNEKCHIYQSSDVLKCLKGQTSVYNKIEEILNQLFNNNIMLNQLNSNITTENYVNYVNYVNHLHKYNKNILEIYDDHIFDMYYKIPKEKSIETEESIKNKTLLQVKIFLDYEKLYNKKTVETQTIESVFKKDKSIQIMKDKEISTITQQYSQTQKVTNTLFYLKDIYD
ncbi:hypothetical protein PFMG_03046 [Plasmodium falciparum IGH-CR14]|uniref:Uncharacterized protein n=1 Tax=Plasmodium falciparum IGH-CR14 TaxID=580059 RepID=A0A0L1IBD8_PLAFA|nr:hypothetical protein PFMG_03046 [Plasmodium falciparum IGH-CR14]